ncbi:MAG: D-alanine--D-alanine ligase [Elusimicrobia bacterium]|nr:D-alanine--D-alanine ligase [Elusimicrobiota bacterium]MDE2425082.1 D-alanine--D-alanine ligase [Elusimicrobiota bacterium]
MRVLVLCGGKSAERQVSLVSARTVIENLDARRYAVELVQIDERGRWLRADAKRLGSRVGTGDKPSERALELSAAARLAPGGRPADVVFPVLHGTLGEDGTVQGLLELAAVPYVGCGVLGSALGMDKELSKRLAREAGLPILPFAALGAPGPAAKAARALGYPVFVKPARLGSSVGISKVKTERELAAAVREAFRYDDKVIIEKGVAARELECAVLGDPAAPAGDALAARASAVGEIVPNAEFYDYKAKYLDENGARLLIPAALTGRQGGLVRELALKAFSALDGYGMARVDFLLDKASGTLYFNEVNTIPGFTSGSMYPLLWRASGLPLPRLLDRLIALARRRGRRRARLKTTP